MTQGSKYGPVNERARRSLRLLRSINERRAMGYRRGSEEDQKMLAALESKLFELDQIHGYDRTWWAVHSDNEAYRASR